MNRPNEIIDNEEVDENEELSVEHYNSNDNEEHGELYMLFVAYI